MVVAEHITEKVAAEIMGTEVLGFEPLKWCFGIPEGIREENYPIPFTADFLYEHRSDAVLSIVPPPGTVIRARTMRYLCISAYDEYRRWRPVFIGESSFRWVLLRKEAPDSFYGKTWEEQKRAVPMYQEVALSYDCIVIAAMCAVVRKKHLFKKATRCQGVGAPVCVKFFIDGRLTTLPHQAESRFTTLATNFVVPETV